MKAQDTVERTKTAIEAKKLSEALKAEEQKEKDAKHLEWQMEQVPEMLKELRLEIKDAADRGETSIEESYDSAVYVAALAIELQKEGYMCKSQYRSGTSNMGDSAAPCLVDWESYDMTVSWNVSGR